MPKLGKVRTASSGNDHTRQLPLGIQPAPSEKQAEGEFYPSEYECPGLLRASSNVIKPGVTSVVSSSLYLVQSYSRIGLKARELVGE